MSLFSPLTKNAKLSLKDQICERISLLISEGILKAGQPLPSCRQFSKQLNVSNNTIVGAYQSLIFDGLVESKSKIGYFVHPNARKHKAGDFTSLPPKNKKQTLLDKQNSPLLKNWSEVIFRPKDWMQYPYPFVCNQMDSKRFPLANWRKCSSAILSMRKTTQVISDYTYDDCDELIHEIQTRLLPSRGIHAEKDEILLTNGAQSALFLTAQFFASRDRKFAIEEPCYPDARNIFSLHFENIIANPVDDEGLVLSPSLKQVDLIYLTPSQQYPTTVKMSQERREALLDLAAKENIILVEDDYDARTDFSEQTTPSLKSLDKNGNVIYINSLSKDINPGLRIGYIVAPSDFIAQLRILRGMMVRHLPQYLQLTTARFIQLGHYDAYINKLKQVYKDRWFVAKSALNQYFSDFEILSSYGSTNFILKYHQKIDVTRLTQEALKEGIVIDAISQCYQDKEKAEYLFRIGVSAIGINQIEAGIKKLRMVFDRLKNN